MKTHEIYEDQIRAQVVIGKIIEDRQHGSPRYGQQFEILENNNGIVTIRELEDNEYVVQSLVFSTFK